VLLAGNPATPRRIPFLFVTAPGPWLYVDDDARRRAHCSRRITYAADLIPAERRAEGIAVSASPHDRQRLAPVLARS
jgi:hypothetical protein